MLMNSGRSLTGDVDLYNTGSQSVDLSNGVYPLSIYQGFGRVELDNVLYFSGSSGFNLFIKEDILLVTGLAYDLALNITAPGTLRVNMGYRDPAGAVSAAYVTVNDIDLYVVANSLNGTGVYAGNFKTKRDSRNNNEGVWYPVIAGDTVYIKVLGVNVPSGVQYASLVITGSFSTPVQLLGGVNITIPQLAEFQPYTGDDSDSDKKSMTTGIVVGILVALCIMAVIWYFVWYVPGNRRRAIAAKQRYDAQHGITSQQQQMGGGGGVAMGVPVQGQVVMGVPVQQQQQPPPAYYAHTATNDQQQYSNQGGVG